MKSVANCLAGCLLLIATPVDARAPRDQASPDAGPAADYPVTIGDPYVAAGVSYRPADTLNYDAVGYAHAATFGSGISGAHHTLPLPCYVEVTSIDSGHTILVRLDRRGPMNGRQLIELSPAAWAQLGLPSRGDAAVRVRRVNPPEPERALLRAGGRAPERMETPPGLRAALRRKLGTASAPVFADPQPTPFSNTAPPAPLRPKPATSRLPLPPPPPPPPAAERPPRAVPPRYRPPAEDADAGVPAHAAASPLVVQVGAFSSHDSAQRVAAKVGGKVEHAGNLWRVRIVAGSEDRARAALAKAKAAGYAGAIILHHD